MLLPGLNTFYSAHFQYNSVDYHKHLIIFEKSFSCLKTFILLMSCFINCSSWDHVISPRMSLIGVNPQRGIIVRVKGEKRFEISFLICLEQRCTLR